MKKITKNPTLKNKTHNGERVRLEGLVRQQADALKVKNGQLRKGKAREAVSEEQVHVRTKAMDATADGIFIVDALKPNFPVIYANQSFQKMTGYGKREILGENYFSLYGADADQRIINEIKYTLRRGKVFHGDA